MTRKKSGFTIRVIVVEFLHLIGNLGFDQ